MSVDSAIQPFGNAPIQRPSTIRYDFSGSSPALADAECSTALVDGDTLHWKVQCPTHPYLHSEEIRVDGQGYVVVRSDPWGTYYTRPADDPAVAVTRLDEAGMPLSATISRPDWLDPQTGVPVSGTGNQVAKWAYDAHERVVHIELAIVGIAAPYLAIDVTYDDANRRIAYRSIADPSAVFPELAPGENGGYDLFDQNLKRVESHWFRPGDDFSYAYTYDAGGRLLTTIADEVYNQDAPSARRLVQYVEHRIYDKP